MPKLKRHNYNERNRDGRYRKSPKCDGCGKRVGTNYCTDDQVCGSSDGPGFFLCDRLVCIERIGNLSVDERRELYTNQRFINDLSNGIIPQALGTIE